MRKRLKVWALGLAIIALLVAGLAVGILWPTPSDSEREAAKLEVGMKWQEFVPAVHSMPTVRSFDTQIVYEPAALGELPMRWVFADGSKVTVIYDKRIDRATSIRTTPAPPVHPLTWLRRKLARMYPALGE